MNETLAGRRVMIVVNTDWFFLSHRLPVALAAAREGADVVVVATDTGRADEIVQRGLRFEDARMTRMGRHPVRELRSLARLWRLLRRHRPDVLHLVATKAVVYGGLAATGARPKFLVSAVTGAGYGLAPERNPALQRLVRLLLRLSLRGSDAVIFQHAPDRDAYVGAGLVMPHRARLVRGVGVEPEAWPVRPEPAEPVVVLAARMIEEKGVRTFVEAAPTVRERCPGARMVLVGPLEPDVPTGIPARELARWAADGLVEWWGPRRDMPEVLAACQVFVLPTFHNEGVPKVLLEAGASARAVVASDIAGCRAVVREGESGVLVTPKDPAALSDAIVSLLEDSSMRRRMACSLRDDVVHRFRERDLTEATLQVYRESLRGT